MIDIKKQYETNRLVLLRPDAVRAAAMHSYECRNREFLKATDPQREKEFFTREHQKRQKDADIASWKSGVGLKLWIAKRELPGRLIGFVHLNSIVRGAFLSCFLGYKLDSEEINKGYMTEAIEKVVEIAFRDMELHRIEANIMPRNKPSLRVVEKLGFISEGTSKNYLKINGIWEDHIHMVKLNDNE